MILDYEDGSKDNSIWNICYHLYLDNESLELLQIQTKKLNAFSASAQSWHSSEYGKLLRICDRGTLLRISKIWNSYGSSGLRKDEKSIYDKRLEAAIQRARDRKALHFGQGKNWNLTSFRSAAPIITSALMELPELFDHFWAHGSTDNDRDSLSRSRFPNPMFAGSLDDTFILHYGTDPLLGFHLASAYASLISESPLKSPDNSHLHKAIAAARLQFREWSGPFRKQAQKKLTIRFFVGDALAFCHTLQHKRITGGSSESNWYRDQYHMEPLVLDGEDYLSKGGAPLLFGAIDTSNLLDHVGAINLLVATSPLLENNKSATLYTEALVRQQEDVKKLVDSILCGHFPTISILFGLMPIEYWTNSTAISTVSEHLFDNVINTMEKTTRNLGQMYSRLTWKRIDGGSTDVPPLQFDELELAHVLYQSYLQMFKNEDVTQAFFKIDLQKILNMSLLHYHRGSIASFLCYVKKKVKVDWNGVMNVFTGLVEKNSTLMMGSNYFQELYVQLYLLGVYSASTFSPSFNRSSQSRDLNGVSTWKDIPVVICITLKVPRGKLGVITSVPLEELSTPILQCVLQSSEKYSRAPWQNIFAGVQLAFGEITTSGSRHSGDFKVSISEDSIGWKGRSSLIVSFMVPTWVIMLEPNGATVALGVQSTPQSSRTFMSRLGLEMSIYKTALRNEENVYITKYRPNQPDHASVCNFKDFSTASNKATDKECSSNIKANVDVQTGAIKTLTGRLDIFSDIIQSTLRNGATVETFQINPCTIGVAVGEEKPLLHLLFPVPVLRSRSKSRIARKSSYIEVVAPIADPRDGNGIPHFMYPTFPGKGSPVLWNMPRLNLDCLPILDTSKKSELGWLNTHTSLMFSSRERHLRNNVVESSTADPKDPRINFKDSLFSLFMHSSGLQGRKTSIFGLNNPDDGGFHILIFVSCLRLDLANHTVVLDAVILPLHTSLVLKLRPFLETLHKSGMCNVTVDSSELRLWKETLPAWIERCRQWDHRPSCEYQAKSQIPLSVDSGHNPICTCGKASLPSHIVFDLPAWHLAAEHAVRAAISPSFCVESVEQSFERNEGLDLGGDELKCGFCAKGGKGDGKGLLKCGRCKKVWYCSKECQRKHWKVHKGVCG